MFWRCEPPFTLVSQGRRYQRPPWLSFRDSADCQTGGCARAGTRPPQNDLSVAVCRARVAAVWAGRLEWTLCVRVCLWCGGAHTRTGLFVLLTTSTMPFCAGQRTLHSSALASSRQALEPADGGEGGECGGRERRLG